MAPHRGEDLRDEPRTGVPRFVDTLTGESTSLYVADRIRAADAS